MTPSARSAVRSLLPHALRRRWTHVAISSSVIGSPAAACACAPGTVVDVRGGRVVVEYGRNVVGGVVVGVRVVGGAAATGGLVRGGEAATTSTVQRCVVHAPRSSTAATSTRRVPGSS